MLLYNIRFDKKVFSEGGSDYSGQVFGLFCKIDMSEQKEDPSKGAYAYSSFLSVFAFVFHLTRCGFCSDCCDQFLSL